VALDRGAFEHSGPQPDRDERSNHRAAGDLSDAVDHHLAVRDVDARCDYDWVPDANLRQYHRHAVGHPREHGNSERLEPCLYAVERLCQKGVADAGEPNDLNDSVERRPELGALTPKPKMDPRVGEQRFTKLWVK